MATTDIYHITGGLKGRPAMAHLGGNSDDYVAVNGHAVARVAANDTVGTYTAWVNISNITGTFTVLGAGDASVVEFLELNIEAGLLTARCTDAAVVQFVTQADAVHFKPHRWYHVAMVQRADGSGVQLFVDGVLIASTNDTATDVNEWYNNLDLIDTFRIGAANKDGANGVTNELSGASGRTKYWSVALTDAEVLQDFQNEAVQAASLQLDIDFVEDLIDAGLGADDGTNTGGGSVLMNNYCEFTSRLRFDTGVPVVADTMVCFADGDNTGHAVIIKAA